MLVGWSEVPSQPYTLAEVGASETKAYNPLPQSHYTLHRWGPNAQREAEAHLELHSSYPGQGVPHIPNTSCTFWLPGLSPKPRLFLPPCTKPLISSPYSLSDPQLFSNKTRARSCHRCIEQIGHSPWAGGPWRPGWQPRALPASYMSAGAAHVPG